MASVTALAFTTAAVKWIDFSQIVFPIIIIKNKRKLSGMADHSWDCDITSPPPHSHSSTQMLNTTTIITYSSLNIQKKKIKIKKNQA